MWHKLKILYLLQRIHLLVNSFVYCVFWICLSKIVGIIYLNICLADTLLILCSKSVKSLYSIRCSVRGVKQFYLVKHSLLVIVKKKILRKNLYNFFFRNFRGISFCSSITSLRSSQPEKSQGNHKMLGIVPINAAYLCFLFIMRET